MKQGLLVGSVVLAVVAVVFLAMRSVRPDDDVLVPASTSSKTSNGAEQEAKMPESVPPVNQETSLEKSVSSTAAEVVSPTPPSGISFAEVAKHNTSSDCWTVVNGNVYNVTSWIEKHPGGEASILRMCGVDGSAGFNRKHGGQDRPEAVLASFLVGPLAVGGN